jgi:hypothetical protein
VGPIAECDRAQRTPHHRLPDLLDAKSRRYERWLEHTPVVGVADPPARDRGDPVLIGDAKRLGHGERAGGDGRRLTAIQLVDRAAAGDRQR